MWLWNVVLLCIWQISFVHPKCHFNCSENHWLLWTYVYGCNMCQRMMTHSFLISQLQTYKNNKPQWTEWTVHNQTSSWINVIIFHAFIKVKWFGTEIITFSFISLHYLTKPLFYLFILYFFVNVLVFWYRNHAHVTFLPEMNRAIEEDVVCKNCLYYSACVNAIRKNNAPPV